MGKPGDPVTVVHHFLGLSPGTGPLCFSAALCKGVSAAWPGEPPIPPTALWHAEPWAWPASSRLLKSSHAGDHVGGSPVNQSLVG